MTKTDLKYFEKACHVAAISDYPKLHIGCIAVYQGHIISVGYNTNKTHPLQDYYNKYREIPGDTTQTLMPKLHAEISCINQLKYMDVNFARVKLYIYRIRTDRPFGMARPCPSCMAAIMDIGIRDIFYTTNDGYAYERISNKERGVA